MSELKNNILHAEQKLLEPLYNYCKNLFTDKKIPSHDHTHHLRVWEYAKEILFTLDLSTDINYNLVESCLIASLFHDTGFTKTTNENHGKESREICSQYFEDCNLTKPDNFEEILLAIEKHDDKEYKLNDNTPTILAILCNADDLDAYGMIGVIRYTEIYLLRGVNINDLPKLVLINLDKRFLNFKNTFKNFPDLYMKHESRYLITKMFFEDLLKETI
ncbi:MAG: HD domain-containing protein [Bacteroidales bacterium]|jgi:HD superfamily phosphodiesterase|nr:HD domain-containing protein [Bacteroidales bacterium]